MGHDNTIRTTSPLMTASQAASEAQVARKTIYEWIRKGLLPAAKLPGGTEIRIRRTDWTAFVEGMFGADDAPPAAVNDDDEAPLAEEDHPQPRRRLMRQSGSRDFFSLGGGDQHPEANT